MAQSSTLLAATIALAVMCSAQTPAGSPASKGPASKGSGPTVQIGPDQIKPVGEEPPQPAASGSVQAPPPASAIVPNPNPPEASSKGQTSSAPASAAKASAPPNGGKPYMIGTLDVLDIKVWNDQKLSGIYDVRPDGMVSLPLIGEVPANNTTVADLTKMIATRLEKVMEHPDVNIQVLRYNSKKFYIFGGVRKPGEFPLNADTTVLEALVNGDGFTDFANPKKIYVLRGDQKLRFNYKEVSQGKHMEQNILLENNDKIFVPE